MKNAISNLFFIGCLVFLCYFGYSQNIDYAKKIVQKISSPEFYGRGYVNKGDSIAASFLAEEFKKIGLKKFGDSYFQNFTIGVNRFINSTIVMFDSIELVPVKDYVVIPSSPETDKKYKIEWITARTLTNQWVLRQFLSEEYPDRILCIDSTGLNNPELFAFANTIFSKNYVKAAGIIEQSARLKFTVRTKIKDFVHVQLSSDKINYGSDSVYIKIQNSFVENYTTANLIGYIPGKSDSIIMITAHYDHLGMYGDVIFPGANDNASGVAMVLSLARSYKKMSPPKYTMVFALFAAEEAGLLGPQYMAENLPFEISKIKVLLNFDMVGTGDKGVYVMNAKLHNDINVLMTELNNKNKYFDTFYTTGLSYGSDHASFHEKGVKALFFYTDGDNSTYHQPQDTYDNCTFAVFEDMIRFVTDFVDAY
jgi:hypothetical protein